MNNDIRESYCSFEVSKLLKKKGFEVPCLYAWDDEDGNLTASYSKNVFHRLNYNNSAYKVSKPSHTVAIEWLRVNFGIWIMIDIDDVKRSLCNYVVKWHNNICLNEARGTGYSTPQEATDAALLYTLQNLIP